MTTLLDCIKDKRLVLNMGKGGVGKTSLSIAMAAYAADQGLNTLVITVDRAKRIKDFFSVPLDEGITHINEGLDALVIEKESVLNEALSQYIPDEELYKEVINNPGYQLLAKNLPGLQPIASVWKIKQILDQIDQGSLHYDLVVVDLPPKGQGEEFLNIAETVTEIKRFIDSGVFSAIETLYKSVATIKGLASSLLGKRRGGFDVDIKTIFEDLLEQAYGMDKIIKDPETTCLNIVFYPEDAVVNESVEIYEMAYKWEIPLGFLVANRVNKGVPEEIDSQYLAVMDDPEIAAMMKEKGASKLLPYLGAKNLSDNAQRNTELKWMSKFYNGIAKQRADQHVADSKAGSLMHTSFYEPVPFFEVQALPTQLYAHQYIPLLVRELYRPAVKY